MKAECKKTFDTLPKVYGALMAFYPARKIHDEVDAANAAEVMDLMAGHKLNRDQADYFELLCDLYEEWEDQRGDAVHATGNELLKLGLDARGETPTDLAALLEVDRSLAYRLVKGTRRLTAEQISKIAAHYALNPAALLPPVA
ncbi:MAG: helix-turn-helix domain-containing protein [Chthoniobacteraceae bacterium]